MDVSLQDLRPTVDTVRRRIQRARDRGSALGEENTKATLIAPVLLALGWRLDDIDDVKHEYRGRTSHNPVDYALMIAKKPCLLIEAKSLDKDIDNNQWVNQLIGYAAVGGVEWCVLTNGDEYRLYNAHEAVVAEEKLFRAVKIADEAQEDFCLDTLKLLSRTSMDASPRLGEIYRDWRTDRDVRAALVQAFEEPDGRLVTAVRARAPHLKPADIKQSLRRATATFDFPVPTFEAPQVPRATVTAGPAAQRSGGEGRKKPRRQEVGLQDLIGAGLVRPPFEVQKVYKGHRMTALILADGQISYAGEVYDSLSTAAGMARMSVIGKPDKHPFPPTNGWRFWMCQHPDTAKLVYIDELRQAYLGGRLQEAAGKVVRFKSARQAG